MRKPTAVRMTLCAALLGAIAPAADAPPPPPLRTADVVAHLARAIAWRRRIVAIEQTSGGPSDVMARDSVQRTATRALQLAFDFGRAAAPLVAREQASSAAPAQAGSSIERAAARAAERVASAEARIAEVEASLPKAVPRTRPALAARLKELQAELNFARQIQDSLQNVRAFLGAQATGADLLSFVDRMERSVPEVARNARQPQEASPAAAEAPFRPESAGIFALVTESVALSRAKNQLDDAIAETDTLRKSFEQIRTPLVADLSSGIRRADAAVADSASQTPEQIDADRREIEALSARFKLVSGAVAPLREHGAQVDVTRTGLVEQRRSAQDRYKAATTYLLFRAGGLIAVIALILGVSELWRRGTFRYVRDPRRRKQFLVLRRVVVSGVVFAVIAIGLVNEVGSMATYAGFLTAGLAVALQNPIASVVAYFFLIGRYGLRVGDRVTISGVTGDVVEIGLVRLYLMEMIGSGADLHPTGRVVGFSNSVLFQPAAIFRQMPGADYVWHAAAVILPPETDLPSAETRLLSAVTAALEPYRERVEQQHAAFQRLVDVPVAAPKPVARLRHVSDGVEFLVRYPVEMRQAEDIDDRVLRALADEIAREPRLLLAPGGAPRFQSA